MLIDERSRCPSVCPSHSCTVSKQLNISNFFRQSSSIIPVFEVIRHSTIPLTPSMSEGVKELGRNFQPMSRYVLETAQDRDGATENAGVENAIRAKLQRWKMQE